MKWKEKNRTGKTTPFDINSMKSMEPSINQITSINQSTNQPTNQSVYMKLQGRLMGPPNATWREIINQAQAQPDILRQTEIVKNIQNILQTNVSVCSSLGQPFVSQMSNIYLDTLNVYR